MDTQVNFDLFTARELNNKLTLYYRLVPNQNEIEIALVGKGTSYLAVGWRPSSTTDRCRQFPYIDGPEEGEIWRYQDTSLMDTVVKNSKAKGTSAEPEPSAEGEPEPSAEGEPEPAADGEPEPAAEGEPEPEPSAAGETGTEASTEGEPEPVAEEEPSADGETKPEKISGGSAAEPEPEEELSADGETKPEKISDGSAAEPEPETEYTTSKPEPDSGAEPEPSSETEPEPAAAEPEPSTEETTTQQGAGGAETISEGEADAEPLFNTGDTTETGATFRPPSLAGMLLSSLYGGRVKGLTKLLFFLEYCTDYFCYH